MSTTPTRPLPPSVRDKLGKLLPMLASDRDGERVGAVCAIGRVLKSAKLDWHDLAGLITAGEAPAQRPPKPHTAGSGGATTEMNSVDLAHFIEALRGSGFTFNARSEEFLDSLLQRADRFNVVYLSPRQQQWLADLASRAGVEL
jgi:hypothetical protein